MSVRIEYIPDNNLTIPRIPFNYTYNYKGNWCSNQAMVSSGKRALRDALEGETLTLALPNETDYLNLREDGSIDASAPGLYIELLEEVARRAKFKWKFGLHQYIYEEEEYTITDLLVWLVQNFDASVNWWIETPDRVNKEVTFPKGWYDASAIIIGKKSSIENDFSVFSWSGPFSTNVWILLIIMLLISGIVHHIVEEGFSMTRFEFGEIRSLSSNITNFIHKSFIVFTGHLDLQAKTKPGQLISFSLSFFAMLMLSSYTANLASFLVNKNSGTDQIEEVGDLVARGLSMCILDAATKFSIGAEFPNAIFVDKKLEADALIGLQGGECDYAVLSLAGWEELQNVRTINDECELVRMGRVYKNFAAGFAMHADAGVYCTSLVREVFHVHFLEMNEDGFVKERWRNHFKRSYGSASCAPGSKDNDDEIQTLTLTNLGGIFIFHGIFLMIAIMFSMGGVLYNRTCREKVDKSSLVQSISKRFVLAAELGDDRKQSGEGNAIHRDRFLVNQRLPDNDFNDSNIMNELALLRGQMSKILEKVNGLDASGGEVGAEHCVESKLVG